ncbi:hypothetical protein ACN47E_000848 [Coniothyrium glycines]
MIVQRQPLWLVPVWSSMRGAYGPSAEQLSVRDEYGRFIGHGYGTIQDQHIRGRNPAPQHGSWPALSHLQFPHGRNSYTGHTIDGRNLYDYRHIQPSLIVPEWAARYQGQQSTHALRPSPSDRLVEYSDSQHQTHAIRAIPKRDYANESYQLLREHISHDRPLRLPITRPPITQVDFARSVISQSKRDSAKPSDTPLTRSVNIDSIVQTVAPGSLSRSDTRGGTALTSGSIYSSNVMSANKNLTSNVPALVDYEDQQLRTYSCEPSKLSGADIVDRPVASVLDVNEKNRRLDPVEPQSPSRPLRTEENEQLSPPTMLPPASEKIAHPCSINEFPLPVSDFSNNNTHQLHKPQHHQKDNHKMTSNMSTPPDRGYSSTEKQAIPHVSKQVVGETFIVSNSPRLANSGRSGCIPQASQKSNGTRRYRHRHTSRWQNKAAVQSPSAAPPPRRAPPVNLWGGHLAKIQEDDKMAAEKAREARDRQGAAFRPELKETFQARDGTKEQTVHDKVEGKDEERMQIKGEEDVQVREVVAGNEDALKGSEDVDDGGVKL